VEELLRYRTSQDEWRQWPDPSAEIHCGPKGKGDRALVRLDGAVRGPDGGDAKPLRVAVLGTGAAPEQASWLAGVCDVSTEENVRRADAPELRRGLPEWGRDASGHESVILDILRHHAPAASFFALKIAEGDLADPKAVLQALLWCHTEGIDLVHMSWAGYPAGPSDAVLDMLEHWIGKLEIAGSLVVAAAGNWGRGEDGVPRGAGSIGTPGRLESVLCIGAATSPDGSWHLSPHSAEGELGSFKPDVLGPGEWTSEAAAHVSGLLLRLIGTLRTAREHGARAPESVTPAYLRGLVRNTAQQLPDLGSHQQGAGIIQPIRWIRRLECEANRPLGILSEQILRDCDPPPRAGQESAISGATASRAPAALARRRRRRLLKTLPFAIPLALMTGGAIYVLVSGREIDAPPQRRMGVSAVPSEGTRAASIQQDDPPEIAAPFPPVVLEPATVESRPEEDEEAKVHEVAAKPNPASPPATSPVIEETVVRRWLPEPDPVERDTAGEPESEPAIDSTATEEAPSPIRDFGSLGAFIGDAVDEELGGADSD